MTTHALPVPEGFQLSAASEFLRGFVPGAGMAPALADPLILAFRLEGGGWEPAAVALRQGDATSLEAEVSEGVDAARALAMAKRVLGLDAPDPAAWLALGARVPLLGRLQREFPGFFTVAKPSPYDAGLWGVLATRISMAQAAKMRLSLTERCGDDVRVAGRVVRVGPDPRRVVELRSVPGIPEEKLKRAVAVSAAALEGKLEAARLRAMPEAAALAELKEIHGVGPWTAAHMLYRGAALHDGLPLEEPRVLNGYADAAGLKQAPSQESFAQAAEAWRPFRMWTCILLARHLNAAGKWQLPAAEAAKRGRRRSAAGTHAPAAA
jgi:DNA-3-methyladenine glycosylase II